MLATVFWQHQPTPVFLRRSCWVYGQADRYRQSRRLVVTAIT